MGRLTKRRLVAALGVSLILAACSAPGMAEDDPTASADGAATTVTSPIAQQEATAVPTAAPTATATPTPTPSPTPTVVPTPTPVPPPLAECYQPRPAALQASTGTDTGTPAAGAGTPIAGTPTETQGATPAETTTGPILRPAASGSLFRSCQVVGYYGHPEAPELGVLGESAPEAMMQELRAQAAEYEATNGGRKAVPALHLIYAVAQGGPTSDGTYLARMSDATVQKWINLAEQHDMLIFLDIQMGHSTVEAEIQHVLPYLKNPRVHLALDPEFATPGQVPGTVIGEMSGAQVNQAQDILQKLVEENRLPNKILIIHQFVKWMITEKETIKDQPKVDLVIDVDGFGWSADKQTIYDVFVNIDDMEHGGFKLFYKQDTDLMTPAEVNALNPQPDFVVYQ